MAGAIIVVAACRNFGEPPTSLTASPPSLTFSGAADGLSPPSQPLAVDQLGPDRLDWTVAVDASWLAVSPASGTAPAVAWVSVVTVGLPAGRYAATITLTAPGSANREVAVPVALALDSAVFLTGRWVGVSDSLNLALDLADASGIVSGSGSFYPPLRPVTVTGTHHDSTVALTLTGQDSSVMTYTGSVVGDNAVVGRLSGPGVTGLQMTVFRQ
jgi:hypothetical protein